jgi:hypothetical protein
MTTNEQWRSTTGLRTALVWLLSGNIVTTVALGIAMLHHDQVVDDYNQFRTNYAATEDASRLLGMAAIALAALLVATTVVFIVWTWRSAKNNEVLGRVQPRHTSGWAIGGWLIPIGNLWIPVQIMQDLWEGSDPEVQGRYRVQGFGRSPLISWWWGLFLASRVLAATPVGAICAIPAAVLAILVVRRVTERQEVARHEPRGVVPGWYADPMGRFDHRYWNGNAWTVHASRGGTLAVDPLN